MASLTRFYSFFIAAVLCCAIPALAGVDDAKRHVEQGKSFLKARQASKAIAEFGAGDRTAIPTMPRRTRNLSGQRKRSTSQNLAWIRPTILRSEES